MVMPVQQSLLEAGGGSPAIESARWVEAVVLGDFALGLCVTAVALVGGLMLTGRLPLRRGVRIVIGCFVLLGAPVIASGLLGADKVASSASVTEPDPSRSGDRRDNLSPAEYDPYAGASLGKQ
jgi:type IV secretory pathway VirB2 component (pilin)